MDRLAVIGTMTKPPAPLKAMSSKSQVSTVSVSMKRLNGTVGSVGVFTTALLVHAAALDASVNEVGSDGRHKAVVAARTD